MERHKERPKGLEISREDHERLRTLEESLWVGTTRFDNAYMERVLSPDFFEFGRSGRVYTREETLGGSREEIKARIPLKDFKIRPISENVVQVTYVSEVTYGDEVEVGNRSSIWVKTPEGWKLRFHQGTPVKKE